MTALWVVRTVRDMGINIYGTYDELVVELWGIDRLLTGRREVRVKVEDVRQVRSAPAAAVVTGDRERAFRAGRGGRDGTVLVLDLAPGAAFDRVVLALSDADATAADLHRSGIGAPVPVS